MVAGCAGGVASGVVGGADGGDGSFVPGSGFAAGTVSAGDGADGVPAGVDGAGGEITGGDFNAGASEASEEMGVIGNVSACTVAGSSSSLR